MIDERINPDEAIDRVLAALGAVEAPQQMERRILDTMQQRATVQDRPAFGLAALFAPSRRWAIAGSVVVLSFAAWLATHKRHEAGREVAILNGHTAAASQTPASRVQRPRTTLAVVSLHTKKSVSRELVSDEESLAISEMNAPSKPAPPLPLTHQEKLLATAVNHAGPEKLSSLRPEVMAQQMELSKAEFRNFFEPPPAKESE